MTALALPVHTQTKNNVDSDVTIQSSMQPTKTTRMSVDTEGAAHIMSLLTDLYSNPDLAVLREYSSNAYDAHIEAKQTKPIEVSLPAPLNPVFIVKDFGIGMSPDTISDIYSSYGKSTKRNDFAQVGAFGLGCKSALTLTQQFTLVSIKDGVKTVATISRGADGVGVVDLISTTQTTEGNGTTVSIPIENVTKFNQNSKHFFMTWKPGSVLVDGVEPENVYSKNFVALSDGRSSLFRSESRYDNTFPRFSIIMGGISYPVDLNQVVKPFDRYGYGNVKMTAAQYLNQYASSTLSILSEIPIASVDLTPSREALRYSPRTKEFLAAVFEQIAGLVGENAYADIAAAPDRAEAVKRYLMWRNLLPTSSQMKAQIFEPNDVKWQGKKVETHITAPYTRVTYQNTWSNTTGDMVVNARSHNGTQFGTQVSEKTFYTNVTADVSLAQIKANLKSHILHTGETVLGSEMTIFYNEVTSEWVTENPNLVYVDAKTILANAKAYRKANKGLTPPRSKVPAVFTYPVLVPVVGNVNNIVVTVEQVKTTDFKATDYYYEEGMNGSLDKVISRGSGYATNTNGKFASALLAVLGPDARIISVSRNRKVDVLFRRAGFKPTNVIDALKIKASAAFDALTPAERGHVTGYHANDQNSAYVNRFKAFADVVTLIEDEKFVDAVNRANGKTAVYSDIAENLRYVERNLGWYPSISVADVDAIQSTSAIFGTLVAKYPLLGLDRYDSGVLHSKQAREHAAKYINTIHKEEGQK